MFTRPVAAEIFKNFWCPAVFRPAGTRNVCTQCGDTPSSWPVLCAVISVVLQISPQSVFIGPQQLAGRIHEDERLTQTQSSKLSLRAAHRKKQVLIWNSVIMQMRRERGDCVTQIWKRVLMSLITGSRDKSTCGKTGTQLVR